MNLDNFGMDSVTLAGTLQACRAAGFSRIMLWSRDLVGCPGGLEAALQLLRAGGLRVAGIQVMRDYEGLDGALHDYKIAVAKNLLQPCHAVGAPLLLVCSSTLSHASGDTQRIARDLAKLANLAVALGIRVGYEALSWGRHVNQYTQAWEIVDRADHANLGLVIDSFHMLANNACPQALEDIPGERIAMVQLSDFMGREIRDPQEKLEAARHLRVFPGEGEHPSALSDMLRRLYRCGYRCDYSLEVFNDDYLQMAPDTIAGRARDSAKWVSDQVLGRGVQMRPSVSQNCAPDSPDAGRQHST